MSLGDVRMMMCYGRPEKVNLTYSIKFITITFLKYHFSVSPESKNNWVYPMSPKFRRDLPTTSRLCPKVMSAYWRPLDVLRTSILNIIQNTLLFYYFRSYSPKLLLISKTSEKRPETSSKRPEKTSIGWPPWDILKNSILNFSYKWILIALFSILLDQMCAWNNKELAVL